AFGEISASYAAPDLAGALATVLEEWRQSMRARAARDLSMAEYALDVCAARHATLYRNLIA
ncbi:MAG TPA: hypothetical protein VGI15_08290, partial [Candidatus Cybelea sp.]